MALSALHLNGNARPGDLLGRLEVGARERTLAIRNARGENLVANEGLERTHGLENTFGSRNRERNAVRNLEACLAASGLHHTHDVTRKALGLKLGARPETFSGLAGMGDLVATCSSPLSRNQTFGRHLGEGMSVAEAAAASRGVAEGAKSARAVLDLARAHGVDMPITAGVVTVVEGAASVAQVTDALLARPRKSEGVHAAPSQA